MTNIDLRDTPPQVVSTERLQALVDGWRSRAEADFDLAVDEQGIAASNARKACADELESILASVAP